MTEHPPTPITTDSAEAALDAGLAAAFAPEATGDYQSRAAGFIPAEVAGTIIAGKYKLLERIGEGGMGSVWMAQQTEPVKRHVAVKLIKTGMDSKQVLARFEAERQALAVMDHPNIAKILDGGVTSHKPEAQAKETITSLALQACDAATGHPFFVMELVKGVPITKYCDDHKLTPRQRLELFVPVCQAIQHAHQKGIIHRDIKPSNVMVALYDDKPIPKVIDFGVAKATGHSLTGQTLNTGFGGIVGTPEYMSPEQASLNNLDIDTRSDIYSLGVLLYELLAGSPPFKHKDLEKAGVLEMLRVIREDEPPRPSTKLSTADALPSLSANRGTEPKKLTGILRNELDWIVMKALEKDRARRYETANGFAADINRYLTGEPVNAHPPSAGYRMKKFLRKHKGPVMGASAVATALLIGIVGFAWQARVAQVERDIAKDERNRALTAEGETKKRADELQKVSNFQEQMLAQVDPTQAGKLLGEDVRAKFESALTKAGILEDERAALVAAFARQWQRVNATDAARELIDRTILKPAIVAIDRQFKDQPLVDAALRSALASRYHDLGLYDAALPLQARALSIRRRVLGEEHFNTLDSISCMGVLLQEQGKLGEAEPYYREALEKKRRILGNDDPSTLTSIANMGFLLKSQGKLNAAEPYFREALEKSRRVRGEEHRDTITTIFNLGKLLAAQGKLSAAEPYLRDALEKSRRVLGEEALETLVVINEMGTLLETQGKLSEAEPYYRQALEKSLRVRGEEYPHTLRFIGNLGGVLMAQGKLSVAEPYLREALGKQRRVLGDDHPHTLTSLNNLALLMLLQGKLKEAELYLRDALATRRRVLGAEHPDTLHSIQNMGSLLMAQGKLEEAEPYLREALDSRRRVLGQEHPDTLLAINNLAGLLSNQGKTLEAEPYYREAVEKLRRVLGQEHPNTLTSINNLGMFLKAQGKLDEAEPYLREALDTRRRVLGHEHPDTLESISSMCALLQAQNKLREAEPLLRQLADISNRKSGPDSPPYAGQLAMLGMNLLGQKEWAAAEPILRECLSVREKNEPDVWTTFNTKSMLGGSLIGQMKYADAETLLVTGYEGMKLRRDKPPKGATLRLTEALERLVQLYTAWHAAEPTQGYDVKAADWKAKLAELKPALP